MLKNDEIVVCVNKKLKNVTYGKKYKIFIIEKAVGKYRDILYIFNDNYKLAAHFENDFASLQEYRKLKLLNIDKKYV